MELLKEVKPVNIQKVSIDNSDVLNDYSLTNLKLLIPARQTIVEPSKQASQSIHIIDGTTKKLRHELLIDIITQYINTQPGIVILYDLDYRWTPKIDNYHNLKEQLGSSFDHVIIRHVKDMGSLIKSLKDIQSFKQNNSLNESLPLGLVVIDNISSFQWEMIESTSFPMEYKALGTILTSLQTQFNCAMITTSLDKQFETGIMARNDTDQLVNVTQIPRELIGYRSVYYIKGKNGHTGSLNMKVFKSNHLVSNLVY